MHEQLWPRKKISVAVELAMRQIELDARRAAIAAFKARYRAKMAAQAAKPA